MADDPKPARQRTSHASSHEPADAPITASTPLPPLNPLPLPAEDDAPGQFWPSSTGGSSPDPVAEKTAGVAGGSAADRSINPLWAISTLLAMMLVSLVLLAVLASIAATVSKSAFVPVMTMIIIVLANIFYAWVVFNIGQPPSQGRMSLSFPRRRRGP
jgi:hypothetical protein